LPLDAWKDNEFIVFGSDADADFVDLVYDVYRTFVDKMEIFCWSSGDQNRIRPLGMKV
jgi:hypothetical protein